MKTRLFHSTTARALTALAAGVFALAGGAVLLSGCSLKKNLVQVACSPGPTPGSQAFEKSVYPLLSSQTRCGQCHVPGNTSPTLGDPNSVASAYTAARPYLDRLQQPETSSLHIQSSNRHCGLPNCEDRDGAVLAALATWAQAESSGSGQSACAGPTPVPITLWTVVGALSPQSQLTTLGGKTYLVFDLAAVGGRSMKISFQVTPYGGGSYLLSSPALQSATKLHIEGLHLSVVNGDKLVDYPRWDLISTDVDASTTAPGTVIDPGFVIALQGGATGDMIQLAVKNVGLPNGVTTSGGQIQPGVKLSYKNDIYPILQTYCLKCHKSAAAGGNGYDFTSYAAMMAIPNVVKPGDYQNSYLYSAPNSGIPYRMPPGNGVNDVHVTALSLLTIQAWITAGAPENDQ